MGNTLGGTLDTINTMKTDNIISYAIFASGNGSNAMELYKKSKEIGHELKCLIVDREDAPIIEKWNETGLPVHVVTFDKVYPTYAENKKHHEQQIIKILRTYNVTWGVLAGYMKILGPDLLGYFYDRKIGNRVLNLHPSLLPSFPGNNAIEDSFNYGVTVHGITIHLVDEGIDSGPIIFQKSFERRSDYDFETYKSIVHLLEHQFYWRVVKNVFNTFLSNETLEVEDLCTII